MPLPSKESLEALGEDGLIDLLTRGWPVGGRILTGVGDDCAVLRGAGKTSWLFKTDAVVAGVHFTKSTAPSLIGRKALARALSDIAAMGGRPVAALITLGLPPGERPARLCAIYAGIKRLAREHDVALVGGETTRARELFLSIAMLGECRGFRPVLRSGARDGDLLFVTGRLGATIGGHHLHFQPRLAEGAWLAAHQLASAMMDLSDGLGADLPRLARASKLGFQLDAEAVPRRRGADLPAAMGDGEDYELLFTCAPHRAEFLKKKWPFATPLHCIGVMRSQPGTVGGTPLAHGFDHFKQRRGHALPRRKLGA